MLFNSFFMCMTGDLLYLFVFAIVSYFGKFLVFITCCFWFFLTRAASFPLIWLSLANLMVKLVLLVCRSSMFSCFKAFLYYISDRIIFMHCFCILSRLLLFSLVRPPSHTTQDPSRITLIMRMYICSHSKSLQ